MTNNQRPDLLALPQKRRKQVAGPPPKKASPGYVQSVIAWATSPTQKGNQNSVPPGGISDGPETPQDARNEVNP